MPAKMMKIAAETLANRLLKVITINLAKKIFPDYNKVAFAARLDKGKSNKYSISNFRPASAFKVYENVITDKLNNNINTLFSSYISEY